MNLLFKDDNGYSQHQVSSPEEKVSSPEEKNKMNSKYHSMPSTTLLPHTEKPWINLHCYLCLNDSTVLVMLCCALINNL